MPTSTYLEMALIALLFAASAFDLAQRRIPNRLLFIGLIGAAGMHLYAGAPMALLATYAAGFVVGLVLFLPLYLARAMAAGDVKLMATVGAFTGPAMALEIGLAAYCMGGLLALLMVLATGRARHAFTNIGAVLRPLVMRLRGIPLVSEPMPLPSVGGMPYALAVSFGALAVLWLRHH